jgi:hypothetical protein
MVNKILVIGITAFVLLIIGSFLISLRGGVTGNAVKESNIDETELAKYRSEDLPEDCRLPEYESNLEWWKQHLSHHKETLYCLDYYK